MTDGSGRDQEWGRGAAADDLALIARVRRFRRDHPTAEIITEHVRLDETAAVFRATITVPDGGKATGYGSAAPIATGASFVEQAEWRAISRALTILGFNPMLVEETAPATATTPEPSSTRVRPLAGHATEATSPQGTEAPPAAPPPSEPERQRPGPTPTPSSINRRTPPPVELDSTRERGGAPTRPERPAPVRAIPKPQPITTMNADPDLADYSFTAFWKWARELGYNSKGAIEELIGQSMTGLSPLELRRRVIAARGDRGHDD